MQWGETKAKFNGQVKPAGVGNCMTWRSGSVSFDYDLDSKSWSAKMYFTVRPNIVDTTLKIVHPDMIDMKCGRLIIENKKGSGMHIKIPEKDVAVAKQLVAEIRNRVMNTPKHNRAEVGMVQNSALSSRKGSENISPCMNGSLSSNSSSSSDLSPVQGQWLSKKTPPIRKWEHTPHPPSKRKLDLLHPDNHKKSLRGDETDDNEYPQSSRFTGLKDSSKRIFQAGNGLSVTNGLGAKSFYGTQNSLISDNGFRTIGNRHRSSNTTSVGEGSPLLKKPRLSGSSSSNSNRMSHSPTSSSAAAAAAGAAAASLASSSTRVGESGTQGSGSHSVCNRDGQTVGFENLGNTCFMNSPLQCLSSLEPLSLDIQSAVAEFGSQLKPNSITRMLYLLMKDVRKLDVNPARVKEILMRLRHDINGKFAPNTQQDAHELVSELLDRVDEEVKAVMRTREAIAPSPSGFLPQATPVEVNFRWFYRTSFYFQECKTEVVSSQEECEMTLMLALDSNTSNLQDCIDKYFESSEVDMKCERCGKDEKASMTRKIVKRPRIFILNLLRYHTDNSESKKRLDHVDIPSYMSIAEFCADDVKTPPSMEPVFMLDREETLGLDHFDIVHPTHAEDRGTFPPPAHIGSTSRSIEKRLLLRKEKLPTGYDEDVFTHAIEKPSTCSTTATTATDIVQPPASLDVVMSAFTKPNPFRPPAARVGPRSIYAEGIFNTIPNPFTPPSLMMDDFDNSAINGDECDSMRPPRIVVEDYSNTHMPHTSSPAFMPKEIIENAQLDENTALDLCVYTPLSVSTSFMGSDDMALSPVGGNLIHSTDVLNKTVHSKGSHIHRTTSYRDITSVFAKEVDNNSPTLKAMAEDEASTETEMLGNLPPLTGEEILKSTESCSSGDKSIDVEGLDVELSEKETRYTQVSVKDAGKDAAVEEVKLMVDDLINSFHEIEKYVEMAEKEGEDVSELYILTQSIISEYNASVEDMQQHLAELLGEKAEIGSTDGYKPENQILLCRILIHKALHGEDDNADESDFLKDTECGKVVEDMLAIRYNSTAKDSARIDHLISDLGQYLAGKRLGVVKPDTPKKETQGGSGCSQVVKNKQEVRSKNTCPETDSQTQKQSSRDGRDFEVCAETHGIKEAKNKCVSLKEKIDHESNDEGADTRDNYDIKTKESEEHQPSGDRAKKSDGSKPHYLPPRVPIESSWVEDWDEECNNNHLSNKNADAFNETNSCETVLGKKASQYSEAELNSIDVSTLPEEEMVAYALALSKYEYYKSNAALQKENSENDGDSQMEMCSDESASDQDIDAASEGDGHEDSGERGTCGANDGGHGKTKKESPPSHTGKLSTGTPVPSKKCPSKTDTDIASILFCDEELSDFDEPDGAPDNKLRINGITTGLGTSSSRNTLLHPVTSDSCSTEMISLAPKEHCRRCGIAFHGACSACGVLDQLDIETDPLDTQYSAAEVNILFDDKVSNGHKSQMQSPSKILMDKCNTTPTYERSSDSSSDDKKTDLKTSQTKHVRSPDVLVSTAEQSISKVKSSNGSTNGNGDHIVPTSPFMSPKREQSLFSPNKPSNLVKSRDYSRLRSPSASPKKRTSKTPQTKFGSASKRLHFPEGERDLSTAACSHKEESMIKDRNVFNGGDDNYSESLSGASVEVNVDDTSYLEGIDSCSFTRAHCNSRSLSPCQLPTVEKVHSSLPEPTVHSSPQSHRIIRDSGSAGPQAHNVNTFSHPSVSEEPALQQLAPLMNQSQSSDKWMDQSEHVSQVVNGSTTAPDESLLENTRPEKLQVPHKSKTHRSLTASFSQAEEKENKHDNQARSRRLASIEDGKADLSYRLVGVVNHKGESLFAGHYTAFAFNMSKQKWFYMNDTHTKRTVESVAKEESLDSGYVFFYMDKDLFSDYQNKVAGAEPQKC